MNTSLWKTEEEEKEKETKEYIKTNIKENTLF